MSLASVDVEKQRGSVDIGAAMISDESLTCGERSCSSLGTPYRTLARGCRATNGVSLPLSWLLCHNTKTTSPISLRSATARILGGRRRYGVSWGGQFVSSQYIHHPREALAPYYVFLGRLFDEVDKRRLLV